MAHRLDSKLKTPEIKRDLSTFKLPADHVLVQIPQPKDETDGGILLPEVAKQKICLGTILKVAEVMHPNTVEDKGQGEPVIGSQILLDDHDVDSPMFQHAGFDYVVINWDDNLGVWLPE